MPHIVVINESTAMSDADIQKMLPALQQQWNEDLKSAWQVEHASFHFLPQRKAQSLHAADKPSLPVTDRGEKFQQPLPVPLENRPFPTLMDV